MNIRSYLNIPFKDRGRDHTGLDCWGLCLLVYRQELGIELPDMGDDYSNAYARGEVDTLVAQQAAKNWNVDITGKPYQLYDFVIFRRGGSESHLGLWTRPGHMMHILHGCEVCEERFDTVRWRSKFSRVLRHAAMR